MTDFPFNKTVLVRNTEDEFEVIWDHGVEEYTESFCALFDPRSPRSPDRNKLLRKWKKTIIENCALMLWARKQGKLKRGYTCIEDHLPNVKPTKHYITIAKKHLIFQND